MKIIILLLALLISSCWYRDKKKYLVDKLIDSGVNYVISEGICTNESEVRKGMTEVGYKWAIIREKQAIDNKGIAGSVCKGCGKYIINRFEKKYIIPEMGCNTEKYKELKDKGIKKIGETCDDVIDAAT